MANFTLEALVERLNNEVRGRWHPSGRPGNDGSPGNTLEDLLGVEENNLQLPDFGDIELKTHKRDSGAKISLLHKEPNPRASTPKILRAMGWRHPKAGISKSKTELSFRSTTRASNHTARGFKIRLEKERLWFEFDRNKVDVSGSDVTGVYRTYGEWLEDIESRTPHYATLLPVWWSRKHLEEKIVEKLDRTLYLETTSRKRNGTTEYSYKSATLFSGFLPERLDQLLMDGGLVLEYDASSSKNHGVKLRAGAKSLTELFSKSVSVY